MTHNQRVVLSEAFAIEHLCGHDDGVFFVQFWGHIGWFYCLGMEVEIRNEVSVSQEHHPLTSPLLL